MQINERLAAIHGYLCADGYISYNIDRPGQKYYHIGFRNTNLTLLNDFRNNFTSVFGIQPRITKDNGRCIVQNKELTLELLKKFGSFYSKDWKLPKMSKKSLRFWLRAYFDSDGWVASIKGIDRRVGLESINLNGLKRIKYILYNKFNINSKISKHKNRNIWTLNIYGKENLEKFYKKVGFLHPKKSAKLKEALGSYIEYSWNLPKKRDELIIFIKQKGRISLNRKEVNFNSIIKDNLNKLQTKLMRLNIKSKLYGPWTNPQGSIWYNLRIKLNDFNKLVKS